MRGANQAEGQGTQLLVQSEKGSDLLHFTYEKMEG